MSLKGKYSITITRWLIATWTLLVCSIAQAQNHEERFNSAYSIDINIFNRYDDHLIDTTYMNNREVFLMLDSIMQNREIIDHTKSISVVSSSSIEGSEQYNRALSRSRMQIAEETFRKRYHYIPDDVWRFSYIPENWSYLHRAVIEDRNVPSREKVLTIIDMEALSPDAREGMLRRLDGGSAWSYIRQHILPQSRGSVSMLFVPLQTTPIALEGPISTQTLEMPSPIVELPQSAPTPTTYNHPILSIRSNLLLDLTSTLNIALELPLTPRLSISAEYINPWWKSWDHNFTWQIQSLYFDLRYWLSKREGYNTLAGWSIGAYAGSGLYDLQPLQEKGVQGEYSDYGVTLSYAHHLGQSRHWLLEYTAGIGYLTTHYRHYYTTVDTTEYGKIKVHNFPWSEETLGAPLPTRLGVTLVYLININSEKRGGQR